MRVVSAKNTKKIGTNKKNILNVDELNAYKVAYGQPLKARDYVTYIGVPTIGFAVVSFILLYNFWFALIMGVLGFLYGTKFYLPKSISKVYELHSFSQRNKFINNLTQILTDDSKTVASAFATVNRRASGEFQQELTKLQARLLGADNDRIKSGIDELTKKYEDDVIFVQYMEQIETAMLEGKTNIDTLKDIKTYHNDIKKKQEMYEKQKRGHLTDMKMLAGIMVIFILAITFSFGFDVYIDSFARKPVGWITSAIYLILMGNFFKSFSVYLFDDSVLEVEL
uniref:hypothetical protein n=1 Tax=Carnobacterium sp. TaxID=48221 RepID=UPI0034506597